MWNGYIKATIAYTLRLWQAPVLHFIIQVTAYRDKLHTFHFSGQIYLWSVSRCTYLAWNSVSVCFKIIHQIGLHLEETIFSCLRLYREKTIVKLGKKLKGALLCSTHQKCFVCYLNKSINFGQPNISIHSLINQPKT